MQSYIAQSKLNVLFVRTISKGEKGINLLSNIHARLSKAWVFIGLLTSIYLELCFKYTEEKRKISFPIVIVIIWICNSNKIEWCNWKLYCYQVSILGSLLPLEYLESVSNRYNWSVIMQTIDFVFSRLKFPLKIFYFLLIMRGKGTGFLATRLRPGIGVHLNYITLKRTAVP